MSNGAGDNLIYEFGAFRLDPIERLLLREGQVVALTPKAFDLLVCLVEHHGHLVEKQTLMTALWPDTVVEEANLAYNISALRKRWQTDKTTQSASRPSPRADTALLRLSSQRGRS